MDFFGRKHEEIFHNLSGFGEFLSFFSTELIAKFRLRVLFSPSLDDFCSTICSPDFSTAKNAWRFFCAVCFSRGRPEKKSYLHMGVS